MVLKQLFTIKYESYQDGVSQVTSSVKLKQNHTHRCYCSTDIDPHSHKTYVTDLAVTSVILAYDEV